MELSGTNFWVLSQCVHDAVPLVTKYLDENTLLCEGVNSIGGDWLVTNNNFFQVSRTFTLKPISLLINKIEPNIGL